MPINTKMAKSGLKKVVKKKWSNVSGPLNRSARAVSTAEAIDLTPGIAGLTNPINKRQNRKSRKVQEAIIENRRRRH